MEKTQHDFLLEQGGPISAAFCAMGICRFQEACLYVRNLPYGRTANRADLLLVLQEGRGTCSGKHALLAELAGEQGQPVKLMLGVFLLDAEQIPAVKPVLEKYGLPNIPEVHTYLLWQGERLDFTDRGSPTTPAHHFLFEEEIEPHQVDSYKPQMHRKFLAQWRESSGVASRFSLDDLWRIREECIAARSKPV